MYINVDMLEIHDFLKHYKIFQHFKNPYKLILTIKKSSSYLFLCKPYHTSEVTQEDAYSQSQFSQGSQGSSLGRFLHNPKVVRLGEIKPLAQVKFHFILLLLTNI